MPQPSLDDLYSQTQQSAPPSLDDLYNQNEPVKPNPAFLPNENKVEDEQYARPDSVQNLKTEILHDPKNPLEAALQPAMVGLKAVAIPFQRAEAAVADVGMEAQKGNTNPLDYLSAAARGITGQQQGELGDLVRTTGFGGKLNEPIARATGLAASIPVAGGVVKSVEKTAESLANSSKFLSGKSMSEYLRPKDKNLLYGKTPETVPADERITAANAQGLLQKMKNRRAEVGSQIGSIRSEAPVKIDINPAINVIDNQIAKLEEDNPREMAGLINRLKDKKSDLLHEVTDENGKVTSSDDLKNLNLADAHDFRERATQTATKNIFSQAPAQDDIYNETMRDVYRSVTSKMNDAAEELIPLNKRYGNLKSAIVSLEDRIKVANKNTGIMGDALSGGMGVLGGHAVGAAAGPAGVAGIVAHRISQTALFKTNISVLLHDVSTGAKTVQELAHSFLAIPYEARNKILQESPSIRNKLSSLFDNHLSMAGKAGSNAVSKGGAVDAELLTNEPKGLPAPRPDLPGNERSPLPAKAPPEDYLKQREDIPPIPKATGQAVSENPIPMTGKTAEQIKRQSAEFSTGAKTSRPSTARPESQVDMSKGGDFWKNNKGSVNTGGYGKYGDSKLNKVGDHKVGSQVEYVGEDGITGGGKGTLVGKDKAGKAIINVNGKTVKVAIGAIKDVGKSPLGLTAATGVATAATLGNNADAKQNIDINKINQIESSGNEKAYNAKSGARGLNQLREPVLKEWNQSHPQDQHSVKDLFVGAINNKIADWYFNKRIPVILKAYKIPDTTENRLKAYNFGAGNLHKGKPLPKETINYIKKYKGEA